jgi:hypothetical protein
LLLPIETWVDVRNKAETLAKVVFYWCLWSLILLIGQRWLSITPKPKLLEDVKHITGKPLSLGFSHPLSLSAELFEVVGSLLIVHVHKFWQGWFGGWNLAVICRACLCGSVRFVWGVWQHKVPFSCNRPCQWTTWSWAHGTSTENKRNQTGSPEMQLEACHNVEFVRNMCKIAQPSDQLEPQRDKAQRQKLSHLVVEATLQPPRTSQVTKMSKN